MPAALPIISAIIAAAGVGTSIYEGVANRDAQSDAQKAQEQALLKQQQAQANQANLTKQEAVLSAQGQAQEQTGGSLTDAGTAALTALLAGYPGYQSGQVGPSGVGSTTLSPSSSTPNIAAILAALRGGGTGVGIGGPSDLSGGNWPAPSNQPRPWQELSNPVL